MKLGFSILGIFLLLASFASADTYVVCWQRMAMRGINAFGQQASCVRCTNPFKSERMAWGVCPDGQGETFNTVDSALDWKAKNCTCR